MAEKLFDGVWNLTPGDAASFLVLGEKAALVIDTGIGKTDIMAEVAAITSLPVELVNTHGHMDHVGGNSGFDSFWIGEKDIAGLSGELKTKAKPVKEGQLFDLGGKVLEVVALPGHTPGSIGLVDRAGKTVFAGDMIASRPIFFIEGQRNTEDFIDSMDKLLALGVDKAVCCHGEPIMDIGAAEKLKIAANRFAEGSLIHKHVEKGEFSPEMDAYVTEEGVGFFCPSW